MLENCEQVIHSERGANGSSESENRLMRCPVTGRYFIGWAEKDDAEMVAAREVSLVAAAAFAASVFGSENSGTQFHMIHLLLDDIVKAVTM